MQATPDTPLARELAAAAGAAEALAAVLRRVLPLLTGAPGEEALSAAPGSAWVSPTRAAEPVVARGEEDLMAAFERGDASLVAEGGGGFPGGLLSVPERIRLLARRLVGDVALEVRHAGLEADAATVDRMLRDVYGLLEADAGEAGQEVPRSVFVGAAAEFPELSARGAEWR